MSPSRVVWTRVDDRILLHLFSTDGGDTRRGIVKAVGCSRKHAVERLDRMIADGIVAKRRDVATQRGRRPNVYSVTDAGRMRAKLCPPQTPSYPHF